MDYKNYGKTIVVRLDKGDEIVKGLLEVAKKEGCALASVTGIGAVDDFEVGIFDLEKGNYNRLRYNGNHEINALMGSLTTKDGEPYLHLHITCTGKDGKVVGGHLFEGKISLTGEIFLQIVDGSVDRKFDGSVGINKIVFA